MSILQKPMRALRALRALRRGGAAFGGLLHRLLDGLDGAAGDFAPSARPARGGVDFRRAHAGGARSKSTRWLCVGLAGGALMASSAATYFTLFLAPLSAVGLMAAAVGIVLARRGGGGESGFGWMVGKPSAVRAASLIALGAALIAWAWLSQSSAPVVWTPLGASAVGSGAIIALSVVAGRVKRRGVSQSRFTRPRLR